MVRVAIIGAGALGQQISHMISAYSDDGVVGFFDDQYMGDDPARILLGKISDIGSMRSAFDSLIIGIGYNHLKFKQALVQELEDQNFRFYTFIHPSAFIDTTVRLGAGIVVYPGVIVDMNVDIGNHCILNNGCIISHDTQIGSSGFLAPGVVVSGNCRLGDMNFLGSGTVLSDGIKTTDLVQTGAGAVVINNLLKPGIYTGVPAKQKLNG